MASACIHGFAPGTCLICQTLNGSKGAGSAGTGSKGAGSAGTGSKGAGSAGASSKAAVATKPTKKTRAVKPAKDPKGASVVKAGRSEVVSGPRVVPKEAPRTGSPAVKVLGVAVAVVAVIVVAWFALHVVFVVLHILELIGVALIAGYLGWAAGVHHGRKTAKRG